jgi:hypothetical protein
LGAEGARGETVVVPLDEDFCFYATLKEEEDGGLRALATIPVNTRIRIVAYNQGSTTPVGNAEYEVVDTNGGIEPVASVGLTVPGEGNYDFVAYSLSSTTVAPAYSTSTISVSPDNDLLWGKELNQPVSAGGNNITIKMFHKFSQVTVRATTAAISGTPAITAITNFSVSPGYNGTLTVASGGMAKGGSITQSHTPSSWSGLNTATVTSASSRVVYTAGETPVSVTIGSVTIGAVTYSGPVAKFDMGLAEGRKYTLTVDFKRNVIWAGSNIYWDGGKLTFAASGQAIGAEVQRRQGVYFKWGSLVGISSIHDNSFFSNYTYMYIPEYNSGTNRTWSRVYAYNAFYADGVYGFDSTPYLSGSVNDRYNSYLGGAPQNTAAMWNDKKGDICRYISENGYGPGGNYRMPTGYELGAATSYSIGSNGWTKTGTFDEDLSASVTDGTYVMSSYISNSNGNVTFPASDGWVKHNGINLRLIYVGYAVRLWSGSASSTSSAYLLNAPNLQYGNSMSIVAGTTPDYAVSVRCVRNN